MLIRRPGIARALFLTLLIWQGTATSVAWATRIYVDDDAPLDPGPNDPGVSDPLESGTQEHPFDSIREALGLLMLPCELQIMPGTFTEELNLPRGCDIRGSGRAATIINGVGGTALSADLYGTKEDLGTYPRLVLRGLTLQHGSLTVFGYGTGTAGPVVHFEDTALIDVQAHLSVNGEPSRISFRGSRLVDSTLNVVGGVFGAEIILFEMVESTMTAGSMRFGASGASQLIDISNVAAPSTSIMLHRAAGGRQELTLRNSDIGALLNGDAYASILRIEDTHFRTGGITAFHGEGGHELTVTDSTFDHGGIAIVNIPDIDVNPQVEISIRRCRFADGGVAMTSHLHRFDPPEASISLSVDACLFESGGISALSTFDPGDAGTVDISLTNNVFSTPLTGVRVEWAMPDFFPADPTLSVARAAISNNTFVGNSRGIQLVTNAHVPPVIGAATSLSNNIVIGGVIGVEVLGTIDHTVTAQNNDVWGNASGNWAGDIADQTGTNGNISVDPLFVNAGAQDYHLASNSPCIDTGVGGPSMPTLDFDGITRPSCCDANGGRQHDIGAFEFAPDLDVDGHNVVADCDDTNPSIWAAPGEVRDVAFTDAASLVWEAPAAAGGTAARFDTLRNGGPAGFAGSSVCIEFDDPDLQAVDSSQPLPGEGYFYLVRAENQCVPGQGPLGFRSDGTPKPGRACP